MHRFALVVLLAACNDPAAVQPADLADSGARVTEGSPEALGMLAFLNDEGTTLELLDDAVGLDKRAAKALIHHRNGGDGVYGTADDDRFDSVEEADDCYYVGDSALAAIEDWALTHDWVALDADDVLGTWDGVTFSVAEAEAVVELANTADASYLDDDLGLDSRAVYSILEARPIASVQQLAGLYYVGGSALNALKEAAGDSGCATPGWSTLTVYPDEEGQGWQDEVPAELASLVESFLDKDDWCGTDGYGSPWLTKVEIDQYDCADQGYLVQLHQTVVPSYGIQYTIEFEVDTEFDTDGATCQI